MFHDQNADHSDKGERTTAEIHANRKFVCTGLETEDFGGDISNREIRGTDWTFVRFKLSEISCRDLEPAVI